MSFTSWLQNLRSALAPSRGQRNHRRRGSLRAATQRLNLEVLEDRSVPSFSPAVSYPTGANPAAVLTADFNGDGKLDLAVANMSSFSNTVCPPFGNACRNLSVIE
jgi:FG-GAP repeat